MDKQDLRESARTYLETAAENLIAAEEALQEEAIGKKIYGVPLLGFADGKDALFRQMLASDVVGEHMLMPQEWMAEARTVISIFYPFSMAFQKYSGKDLTYPGGEWIRGPEGSEAINGLLGLLKNELERAGGNVVVPRWDDRYWHSHSLEPTEGKPPLTSNWSERHVAYVCGLGTFSLSRALITECGIAGRLRSLITDLHFASDLRPYQSMDEYCSKCGACVRRCPVGAISLDKGKDNRLCLSFLQTIWDVYPSASCSACQVHVPCSLRRP